MSVAYLIKRLILFFVVLWAATTFIFFLPKLAPRDPIMERMVMLKASGGVLADSFDEIVKAYQANFGLDQPLWRQYVTYITSMARLDFNYSLAQYPAKVIDLIGVAMPWTIGLLTMTTLLSFVIGTILGGLLGWPKAHGLVQFLLPPLITLSAIPYYLLGIIFIYLFTFVLPIFPIGGGFTTGTVASLTMDRALDILYHSVLPALSIIAAALGSWAIGMRGMMVTTLGEDYVSMAEAKGLKGSRIFLRYAMRNALLPQMTSLALSLGHVLSGALLVEVIFRYPGLGSLLFKAITGFDYFVIYGVVFFIIVTIGLATLVLDLTYPLLDPRIRYQR